MASNSTPTRTGSRETLWAILGSLVVAMILASFFTGNPFSSLSSAYKDYSAAPKASTTPAPAPAPPK